LLFFSLLLRFFLATCFRLLSIYASFFAVSASCPFLYSFVVLFARRSFAVFCLYLLRPGVSFRLRLLSLVSFFCSLPCFPFIFFMILLIFFLVVLVFC
jgi:hypothetical protein